MYATPLGPGELSDPLALEPLGKCGPCPPVDVEELDEDEEAPGIAAWAVGCIMAVRVANDGVGAGRPSGPIQVILGAGCTAGCGAGEAEGTPVKPGRASVAWCGGRWE